MERLNLETFLSGDDFYQIHRTDVRFTGSLPETVHAHTFCELFLVEEGKGTHLLNNQTSVLTPQSFCLIRRDDIHAISSRSGLRLVNIAFPAESLSALSHRYGFSAAAGSVGVSQWQLGERDVSLFRQYLDDLAGRPNTRIGLELFLLQVLELVQRLHPANHYDIDSAADSARYPARIPCWVREFYRLLTSETHMTESIDRITERVGFSREHASRQIQRYYGESPSSILSETRIRYAARELHMSDTPIIQIAFACGFSSLSQFYAVFRSSVGMTPAAYHRRHP